VIHAFTRSIKVHGQTKIFETNGSEKGRELLHAFGNVEQETLSAR
jgi:hypothetical protein